MPLTKHGGLGGSRSARWTLVAVAWWMSVTTLPLLAYVDPGSGTLVAQLVLGGLAGFIVLLKVFRTRIKASLGRWASRFRLGPR